MVRPRFTVVFLTGQVAAHLFTAAWACRPDQEGPLHLPRQAVSRRQRVRCVRQSSYYAVADVRLLGDVCCRASWTRCVPPRWHACVLARLCAGTPVCWHACVLGAPYRGYCPRIPA